MPNSYFRSCLLSLATFPEDDIIFVSDLIQLWIVESFIPHTPIHTQEETAHIYVTGLAERSLVQVVEISKAHGWIEKIKIHDNVRQWCIEEARQDGFLNIVDKCTGYASLLCSHIGLFSYQYIYYLCSSKMSQVCLNLYVSRHSLVYTYI
jgi:hypothetical protein